MPTKLRKLINSARASARFRGHRMGPSEIKEGGHKAWAKCRECSATYVVLPRPFVNETEISGEAIALHCPSDKDMAKYLELERNSVDKFRYRNWYWGRFIYLSKGRWLDETGKEFPADQVSRSEMQPYIELEHGLATGESLLKRAREVITDHKRERGE